MKLWFSVCFLVAICLCFIQVYGQIGTYFDLKYWRCVLKKSYQCPDNNIKYYLYTPETGQTRLRIDVRNDLSLKLSGFVPSRKNVIIIHGFNGTESKTPMTILRDGTTFTIIYTFTRNLLRNYLPLKLSGFFPSRKKVIIIHGFNGTESKTTMTILPDAYLYRADYNIFTIDWADLTAFPCYLSSLSNTRLVSQCTAKLYAFLMDNGGNAEETTCVGHSLGAHICGMVSNHLSIKQHKIVGLDPARPLIDRYANKYFRLTKDDAHQVQIIHTNAGFLGERNQVGHVDFCVNGGMMQPACKGNRIRIARCSHFQSACFFAKTIRYPNSIIGRPCTATCPKKSSNWGYLPGKPIPMGHDTPYGIYGSYCVQTDTKKDCPFD